MIHHFSHLEDSISLGRIRLGIWSFIIPLKMVDFAVKHLSCKKNGDSENGRVGRHHREKCQKNTDFEIVREVECFCLAKRIEAIAMQCTVVIRIPRGKSYKLFRSRKKALCDPSEFCSFMSRFARLRKATVLRRTQNIRQKSLGSLPKTE